MFDKKEDNTKMNINSLQAQRNAKRFENLSLEEQKYIKIF